VILAANHRGAACNSGFDVRAHSGRVAERQIASERRVVHGLAGDLRATWQHTQDEQSFWPQWLAGDVDARCHARPYDRRPRAISALTLAEIRTLDAGRWFERKFAGTRVPVLDEVLAWSRGRLGILVELKNCPERDPKFIDEVIAAIERQSATDFAIPASFDHPTLAEIHRRRPSWTLEMIVPCRLVDTVHAARAAGSRLVSLEPEYTVKSDVQEMHAAQLSVLTPLQSIEHGRELYDMGVDFFESDDVQLARAALRALGRG
jgi:glycerophosphoryl diester phosphodiesterase